MNEVPKPINDYIERVGTDAQTLIPVVEAFQQSFRLGIQAVGQLIHDTAKNALAARGVDTDTPGGKLRLAGETILVAGLLPIHGLLVAYSNLPSETIATVQKTTGLEGRGWIYG